MFSTCVSRGLKVFSENAIARYSDCLCTTGETEDNQQVAKQNVSLTSRPLPNRGSKINAQLPKACSPQARKTQSLWQKRPSTPVRDEVESARHSARL